MSNITEKSGQTQAAPSTPLSDDILGVAMFAARRNNGFDGTDARALCDNLIALADRVRALELAAFVKPVPAPVNMPVPSRTARAGAEYVEGMMAAALTDLRNPSAASVQYRTEGEKGYGLPFVLTLEVFQPGTIVLPGRVHHG